MTRALSSQKFIVMVVMAVVVLIALWFIVPPLKAQIDHIGYIATHYVTEPKLTEAERAKAEQEIRDIEDNIKRGELAGGMTVVDQYLQLGIDFSSIGRNDLAIDAYTRAAQADPASYIPYNNMGSVHATAKNYEAAKDAYRQAIAKAPTESSSYQKLAELYWFQFNEIAVARGVFIEGLIGTNQDVNLMRSYASFLQQTGYASEALMYWKEVLKNTPNDTFVRERVKELTPLVTQ